MGHNGHQAMKALGGGLTYEEVTRMVSTVAKGTHATLAEIVAMMRAGKSPREILEHFHPQLIADKECLTNPLSVL